MTELSELKVGDKATVEIVCVGVQGDSASYDLGGNGNLLHFVIYHNNVEVRDVVRKPVEPEVGQVWLAGDMDSLREVLYVGDGVVFYKYVINGKDYHRHLPLNSFKKGKIVKCAD